MSYYDILNIHLLLAQFELPKFYIHRTICNVLEEDDDVAQAIEYFQEAQAEIATHENIRSLQARWELSM